MELGRKMGKERSRNWSFLRAQPQAQGRPETPSAKRRAFLALRVRQGNGHVVMLTELGLSISMLSRISFLALRWGLGIVKQGLVVLFYGHRDGSSWEKSNSSKLLLLAWGAEAVLLYLCLLRAYRRKHLWREELSALHMLLPLCLYLNKPVLSITLAHTARPQKTSVVTHWAKGKQETQIFT